MKPHARLLIVLALCPLLAIPAGCSMMQRKPKTTSPQQAGMMVGSGPGVGQLTSRQTGDHERALRMGRDILREKGLLDKYDIDSATAYDKGDQWEVCFTPRKGVAKRLRRKCFTFPR